MQPGVIVGKILRSLPSKFNYMVCSIMESHSLDEMMVDELHGSLLVHEQRLVSQLADDQVLKITVVTAPFYILRDIF
ncbi:unnamed protein product [Rhodiola kirilowii]